MTVNELIDALQEYKREGAGNTRVFAVPDSDSENVMKAKPVRFVTFHGIHNGEYLNIFLGVTGGVK